MPDHTMPDHTLPDHTLLTSRLRLDPWSQAHTALLAGLAAMPEVVRFIGDGSVWSPARAEEVGAANREHWRRHGFGWRAAVERETGEMIGLLALNFAGEGSGVDIDEYEIGWWLRPAAWGRGLAREGAAAVRDEAFTRVGAPRVLARIQPANQASLSVATATDTKTDVRTVRRPKLSELTPRPDAPPL